MLMHVNAPFKGDLSLPRLFTLLLSLMIEALVKNGCLELWNQFEASFGGQFPMFLGSMVDQCIVFCRVPYPAW